MSEALVRVRSLVKGLGPGKIAERAGLEAYAAKLATVIHPIRSVPPEILSEIFSHLIAEPDNTCQSVKDGNFVDSLDTKSDIVTTASSLWTTVGLHLDKYPKSVATANILATYLARSNEHDLNVIIHYEGEISAHPAMEVLMTTCERWRGGWFALLFETFLVWDTPFPFKRLEKLRVCMPQLEVPLSIEDPKARCRAFSSALGLRDVAVDNHFIFRLLFDLNWSIVHRFCQEQRFSEDFSSLVQERTFSDMAQFDIEEVGEARWLLWRNMPLSMVRNAALSFLVLKGAPRGWQQMFSYLELPNLQTLHCHPSSTVELFPAPLPAVIGNGLHKLVVHVVANTNTDRIIAFLKMTPNLVQLTMTFDESFDIGPICAGIFSVTPD
ncbi:hypothetical protein CPB85DRAFT_1456437 [Mucidula mucida]|nr:hypothetical protein CPB85DRAFT_1456437 [Mucidula mucida]